MSWSSSRLRVAPRAAGSPARRAEGRGAARQEFMERVACPEPARFGGPPLPGHAHSPRWQACPQPARRGQAAAPGSSRPKAWDNKAQGIALGPEGKGKALYPIRKPCRGARRQCLWHPFRASKRRRKMEWLWMPITQGVYVFSMPPAAVILSERSERRNSTTRTARFFGPVNGASE